MIEAGVKICLVNFFFKTEKGDEILVPEMVSLKLPDYLIYKENCYVRALREVSKRLEKKTRHLKANAYGYEFRTEIIRELDALTYINMGRAEKMLD